MDLSPDVLRQGLIFYILLIASLCIHEWAHAFTADKLGDDTPRLQGRVTLNPLAHMDLLGSVVFPLLAIFVLPGNFLFGWGKPVIVNVSNFRHRVRDDIFTTAAGPLSNLLLALFFAVVGGFALKADPRTVELFGQAMMLNVTLAVFNLIPLPPLDGGHIMRHAVGMSEETFLNISRWGFLIIIVLLNFGPFRMILMTAIGVVASPFLSLYQHLGSP